MACQGTLNDADCRRLSRALPPAYERLVYQINRLVMYLKIQDLFLTLDTCYEATSVS